MDDVEHRPHTLAEFIALSNKYSIIPEGLPEGISAALAAHRFGEMSNIMLKPLPFQQHYFYGWFELCGRRIETENGDILFTLFGGDLIRARGYRLRIEPVALKLLEAPTHRQ